MLCLKNCLCDVVKWLQQDKTCFNKARGKIIDMGNKNEGQTWVCDSHSRTLAGWISSLWYCKLSFNHKNSNFSPTDVTGSTNWRLPAPACVGSPEQAPACSLTPCYRSGRGVKHLLSEAQIRQKPQLWSPVTHSWGHESKINVFRLRSPLYL